MPVLFQFVNERYAPAVSAQPLVSVRHWRALEAAGGQIHLLIVLESSSLRITSSIAAVDLPSATLITQSGRRYQLLDAPEQRQAERAQLTAYAVSAGLANATDVSDALWQWITLQKRKAQP